MRPVAWWGGLSRRRRLLMAVLSLVIAAGAIAGVVASLAGNPAVPSAGDGRPGDVLLVPGYGGSTTALDVLAARIRKAGGAPIVVQLVGNGTGDLQEQANVLNGYVNRALAAGSGQVTVIGYSAGGVVAWLWDVEYDGKAKARQIITLGSPLHGADLAALGTADLPDECPAACQELVPGSAMLTRLLATAVTTRPPWLSLWTTDDRVVQPPDSAQLPGAVNVPLQSVCPGVAIGHGQLPTAPLVVGIVLRTLHRPAATAPSPSDCRSLQDLGSDENRQLPAKSHISAYTPDPGGDMGRGAVRIIGSIGAAALVALGAGCARGSVGSPSVPAPDKPDITVGAVPVADEAGLFIAEDQGLFAKVGLHVKIDPIVSSADATKGQNDGTFDITAGNSVSYIQAQASGQSSLEIVAEGSLMQPGNQALYTLSGSSITSVAGLAGQRIGVNALNNIGTLLISSVLEENGISPTAVHFEVYNFPQMVQALRSHAIDAAWLPEPFGSADVASNGLQQLTDLDQGATMTFPVGWYVVTKAWAKKYPHTLAAFLAALRQGQQIADSDRLAVEKAMEQLPSPYNVPAVIAAIMSVETYPLDTTPDIDTSRIQRVADAMYRFHLLTSPFQTGSMLGSPKG